MVVENGSEGDQEKPTYIIKCPKQSTELEDLICMKQNDRETLLPPSTTHTQGWKGTC